MQKQQARWSSLEGVTLALNLILGSFFVFTLVRSPGGELVLTVLVASVSFAAWQAWERFFCAYEKLPAGELRVPHWPYWRLASFSHLWW